MPFHKCFDYEVPGDASDLVWHSLGEGGAFVTRKGGKPFTFATGQKATLKLDAERLADHPRIVERLLGLYAMHPCIIEADALSFVPNGMADFADKLSRQMGKQLIRLIRPDGAQRTDIRFVSPEDEALANSVSTICSVEDISRTGFSAHATARMLRGTNPQLDVHTLSMLQRDTVDPSYATGADGIAYHTFAHRHIPLAIEEFREQFPGVQIGTVI